MPQIFDRSSNALARMSLVLTGLIVIALGVTLDQLQRSPWVTRQGQRAGSAEYRSATSTTSRALASSASTATPRWSVELRGHSSDQDLHELPCADLDQCAAAGAGAAELGDGRVDPAGSACTICPDYVYFNHSIHVNKGIGCASCHGRVDQMPMMYQENSLQMEWCLNCHRNPAKNLRPTNRDLQHGVGWPFERASRYGARTTGQGREPTAQNGELHDGESDEEVPEVARRFAGYVAAAAAGTRSWSRERIRMEPPMGRLARCRRAITKFTNQMELGKYLTEQYHIRDPQRAGELRDVPPMKTTCAGGMTQGTGNRAKRWLDKRHGQQTTRR